MAERRSRLDVAQGGDDGGGGHKGVAAVSRALSILNALESRPEQPTLSELSRRTGLYKSTILRLLETLQAHGYVIRIGDGSYMLGPAVYRLGRAYERRQPLRELVMGVLEQLVAEGTESPSFHVRNSATTRVCLYRLDSNHATLDRVSVGDTLPLDRGAAGKVIRALEDAEGRAYDLIRREGFVVSLGERDASCAGMAAPVFGADAQLIGALSLSGPRDRFTEQDIARMRPSLLQAAQSLTASLGGQAAVTTA